MQVQNQNTVLAIDFGTSNSLVGAWHDGKRIDAIPIDPAAADPTLMRTILYFPNQNECHYGTHAIQSYVLANMEGRLFRSFKSHLPNKSYLGTYMEDRLLTLENTIGIFLLELKKRAEKHLGCEVNSAVLGRPARYSMDPIADEFALFRMKKAADFAGFKNVEFVPEPLAAALDVRRTLTRETLVLVGDFGGGTSDFTLLKIGKSEFQKSDVLGLDGCPLAGDALDSLFMSKRLNTFFGAQAEYKMPMGRNRLRMPPTVMERLNKPAHISHLRDPDTYSFIQAVRKGAMSKKDQENLDRLFLLIEDNQIFSFFEKIEQAKRVLSEHGSCDFHFDYPGLEIESQFSRNDFINWAQETKQQIFAAMDRCLSQANVTENDVDMVCLTGGTGKVPLIRDELARRFGEEKMQTQSHFHSVLSGLVEACQHYAG